MRHDRTGTYRAVIAYGDTGQDSYITAYPDITTDGHGFRPLLASSAFARIGTMARAVDMYARS